MLPPGRSARAVGTARNMGMPKSQREVSVEIRGVSVERTNV